MLVHNVFEHAQGEEPGVASKVDKKVEGESRQTKRSRKELLWSFIVAESIGMVPGA